jgi:cell division protein FtsB
MPASIYLAFGVLVVLLLALGLLCLALWRDGDRAWTAVIAERTEKLHHESEVGRLERALKDERARVADLRSDLDLADDERRELIARIRRLEQPRPLRAVADAWLDGPRIH